MEDTHREINRLSKIEDQLHVLEKAFKTSEESLKEAKRQLTQQKGTIIIQNTIIMKLNEQNSEVKREKLRQKNEYEDKLKQKDQVSITAHAKEIKDLCTQKDRSEKELGKERQTSKKDNK